jgi:hypothetical protein
MESALGRDDGVTILNQGRDYEKRVQQERGGFRIRRGIGLTGPGAKAGVGDRTAVVMARWPRPIMLDRTGHRQDGEEEVGPRENGRKTGGGCFHAAHSIMPCNV